MIFLLFFEQEYPAAVRPPVASTSRPLAQAGSVFCENFLAAFAFSPWLRLVYSALLRVLVALPVSRWTACGAVFRRTGIQPFSPALRLGRCPPPSSPIGLLGPRRRSAEKARMPVPLRGREAGLCPHRSFRPPVASLLARVRKIAGSPSRRLPAPWCFAPPLSGSPAACRCAPGLRP